MRPGLHSLTVSPQPHRLDANLSRLNPTLYKLRETYSSPEQSECYRLNSRRAKFSHRSRFLIREPRIDGGTGACWKIDPTRMSPKPWTEGREVGFKVSRLLGFMGFRIIGFGSC